MKIFIPIFADISQMRHFDLSSEQNPGCGGTQHVSILLASRLAKAMPGWNIYLVNRSRINLKNIPSNIVQVNFESFRDFCSYFAQLETSSHRAIIPEALLKTLVLADMKTISQGVYCWIHHPFSFSESIKKASFLAYVCVGQFQQLSVSLYYRDCIFIQNIFPLSEIQGDEDDDLDWNLNRSIRIVHLGALVPAKGFLHIAKQWKRLKSRFPNIVFDVIGASSTYSEDAKMHPLIPTDNDFAEKILKYIPVDDINKHIIFHGNLGPEKQKIIKHAHIAILNPTGHTEAFPASPLECMSLGTPVIAANAFGMRDAMQFFPELSVKKPSQIVSKLDEATNCIYKYLALRKKSKAVAGLFASLSDVSTIRWIELINSPGESKSINSKTNNGFWMLAKDDCTKFLYILAKTIKYQAISLARSRRY